VRSHPQRHGLVWAACATKVYQLLEKEKFMKSKQRFWFAAVLLGSALSLPQVVLSADKTDMKDEKAGMMKDEKGKMKDAKGKMKDDMKMEEKAKAKMSDDKMKMDKMEEKKK
jgi:hypothetical protein